MMERLSYMYPEIALFVTTCLVMVVGLSRNAATRGLTPVMAAIGVIIAGFLAYTTTPTGVEAGNAGAGQVLLPNLAMYMKVVIAGVGLLLLLIQAGTVDRVEEALIAANKRTYDPLRANRAEYYAFFLFSLTGLMLCASADSLIWLFLALELTSLPTYIMVTISTARTRVLSVRKHPRASTARTRRAHSGGSSAVMRVGLTWKIHSPTRRMLAWIEARPA